MEELSVGLVTGSLIGNLDEPLSVGVAGRCRSVYELAKVHWLPKVLSACGRHVTRRTVESREKHFWHVTSLVTQVDGHQIRRPVLTVWTDTVLKLPLHEQTGVAVKEVARCGGGLEGVLLSGCESGGEEERGDKTVRGEHGVCGGIGIEDRVPES